MRGVCDDHMNKIVNIRLLLIYFSSSIQLILFQTKTLYYQSSLEEKLLIFCCCCLSIPSFENFYGQIFIHPSFCFFFATQTFSDHDHHNNPGQCISRLFSKVGMKAVFSLWFFSHDERDECVISDKVDLIFCLFVCMFIS